jgi:hypothetical protein
MRGTEAGARPVGHAAVERHPDDAHGCVGYLRDPGQTRECRGLGVARVLGRVDLPDDVAVIVPPSRDVAVRLARRRDPHRVRSDCAHRGNRQANIELSAAAIAGAVAAGAEIVVLPELATSGHMFADADEAWSVARSAESSNANPSPTTTATSADPTPTDVPAA